MTDAAGAYDALNFDSWRAARKATAHQETTTIFGQQVPIPTDIPIDLLWAIEDADTDDVDTVTDLVGQLFGADELNRWRDAGCTVGEFAVLLTWAVACVQGQRITFEEAAEMVAAGRRGELPKALAPNRAVRRSVARRVRRR